MKIYIVCPYFKTGGPEAMHQLCHELNNLKYEAYIFYLNKKDEKDILYQDIYPLIKESLVIEDTIENVIIYPEIYTKKLLLNYLKLNNIRFAIWWLSLNNAVSFNTLEENVSDDKCIHLFQSYYVKEAITKNLKDKQVFFDLHDYTNELFILNSKTNNNIRENIVAYNPIKDAIIQTYIIKWNLLSLPLVDLTPRIIVNKLKECKIYVDLGAHPGQDRIPREAALMGCVIITNKLGAANNEIDIPIAEKVDGPEELKELIEKVFNNYDDYYEKQKSYRESILTEKERFTKEVSIIANYLLNNDK